MNVNPCEVLNERLGAMFECRPQKDYFRVRTPFWYPDGGVVDLFVKADPHHFLVTDLGEALGWLKLQSMSGKRSPKQQKLLQDVCLTLGVQLYKGQLVIEGADPTELATAITRLGQAAVRVTDLWFTTRTRSIESVTDEVDDYLQEQHVEHDKAVKLAGRSGRAWTIDFQTRTTASSALVCVLASGSRPGARRVTEHVVAGWHDLTALRAGTQGLRFISLFNDTTDVWGEEDFRLAESLSDIARWSRPDEFVASLKAA